MGIHVERELLITDLPREAIRDCHHQGACDSDVEYWQQELDFTVDRENAIQCLTGYGAWDDLESWDDVRLAQTVLWLACGSFSEYMTECEAAGIDPFGERPEDFDPCCGSDLFCLE